MTSDSDSSDTENVSIAVMSVVAEIGLVVSKASGY